MGHNSVSQISSGTRFPKNADFHQLLRSPSNLVKLSLLPCSLFNASRLFDNHLGALHAVSDKFESVVNPSLDRIRNFYQLDICSLSWKFYRKSVAEFSTFRIIFYFRPMCTSSLSIYSQLLSIAKNINTDFFVLSSKPSRRFLEIRCVRCKTSRPFALFRTSLEKAL